MRNYFSLCDDDLSYCHLLFQGIGALDLHMTDYRICGALEFYQEYLKNVKSKKLCERRQLFLKDADDHIRTYQLLRPTSNTNLFSGLCQKTVLLIVEVHAGLLEDSNQPLRSPRKGGWLEPLAVLPA
jgi:hypothetical protein